MKRITGGVVAVVILATGCGGGGQSTGKVERMVKRELIDEAVLERQTDGVLTCAEKGDRRYDCQLSGSDAGDCEYDVQISEDERRVVVSDVTKLSAAAARRSYCH